MSHEKIQREGWAEEYVRGRLAPEDSAAFEEHYFGCDRCFAEVQEMEIFVSGMKDAGRRGLLNPELDPSPVSAGWLMPAFLFAVSALLLLAVGLGYMLFIRLPNSEARLQTALAESHRTEAQLAELNARASSEAVPQANVPVVILTADRSANEPADHLTIGKRTTEALLWIDIPPQPAGTQFQITITAADGSGKTIRGLERNENGALAASIPVNDLAAGTYVVRLYPAQAPGGMIAEYRMTVSRE
ncbi:MAG: zf-HC2 domain-containing protein [Bryobacteraceae bacterium]